MMKLRTVSQGDGWPGAEEHHGASLSWSLAVEMSARNPGDDRGRQADAHEGQGGLDTMKVPSATVACTR